MFTDRTVRQAKATSKPYTIADFDGHSRIGQRRQGLALPLPLNISAPAFTNGAASRSCRGLR